MRVSFEASFARDLKQIRDKRLLQRVQAAIEEIKLASDVLAVSGLSKMQGYDAFYRIRLGDYRIGVEIVRGDGDLRPMFASKGYLSILPVSVG